MMEDKSDEQHLLQSCLSAVVGHLCPGTSAAHFTQNHDLTFSRRVVTGAMQDFMALDVHTAGALT